MKTRASRFTCRRTAAIPSGRRTRSSSRTAGQAEGSRLPPRGARGGGSGTRSAAPRRSRIWGYARPSTGLAVFASESLTAAVPRADAASRSRRGGGHVPPASLPLPCARTRSTVLAISQNEVPLYQEARSAPLRSSFERFRPTSEALEASEPDEARARHRRPRRHPGTAWRSTAAGPAAGAEGDPAQVFPRAVDKGLPRVPARAGAPLPDRERPYYKPMYRGEANTYPHLLDEGIDVNFERANGDLIHARALPIVTRDRGRRGWRSGSRTPVAPTEGLAVERHRGGRVGHGAGQENPRRARGRERQHVGGRLDRATEVAHGGAGGSSPDLLDDICEAWKRAAEIWVLPRRAHGPGDRGGPRCEPFAGGQRVRAGAPGRRHPGAGPSRTGPFAHPLRPPKAILDDRASFSAAPRLPFQRGALHLAERQSPPSTVLYAAKNPQGRRFSAEDLWKIHRIGTPAPALNGSAIVVPVTTFDLEKNRGRARLWLIPAEGEPRPLTSEDANAGDLCTRPRGKRLPLPALDRGRAGAGLAAAPGRRRAGAADGHASRGLRPAVAPGRIADRLRRDAPAGGAHAGGHPGAAREAREGPGEGARHRGPDLSLLGPLADRRRSRISSRSISRRARSPISRRMARDGCDFMDPAGQYDVAPDGSEIAFVANSSRPPHFLLRWALYTVPTSGAGAVRCLTPEGVPGRSRRCAPAALLDGRTLDRLRRAEGSVLLRRPDPAHPL